MWSRGKLLELVAGSWIALGACAGLLLAGGRVAVLFAMERVVGDTAPALARLRLTVGLSRIVVAALLVGWGCAWLAWVLSGSRPRPSLWLRIGLVLVIGALFQALLAGWFDLDASRVIALQTSAGQGANALLAAAALVLAGALVARTARNRQADRPRPRPWFPVLLVLLLLVFVRATHIDRPNLILIVVDTLRADYVHGAERNVSTPNLDALGREGIVFEHTYSHAASTLPAHTALFSSRYPHLTGVLNNGQPVGRRVPLLAEWLRACGYDTRAVVSLGTLWNLWSEERLERGFALHDDEEDRYIRQAPVTLRHLKLQLDELVGAQPFFLFAHFSDPHEPYNAHGTAAANARVLLDGELLAELGTADMSIWEESVALEPGDHRLRIESDQGFKIKAFSAGAGPAVSWEFAGDGATRTELSAATIVLRNDASAPMAADLSLWIKDVPSEDEIVARYGLEVEFIDRHLGELIAHLRALDLWDDALVVFTSDHGEALGEHGMLGHASSLYEEQIHVPLIVKPPLGRAGAEGLRANRAAVVRHIDLVPTMLALLDVPSLPDQLGVSLLEDGPRVVIAEIHPPEAKRELYALRDHEYKLIFDAGRDSFELYHLPSDPGEQDDLYVARPDARPDWAARLRAIAASTRRTGSRPTTPEELESLRALGYGGE